MFIILAALGLHCCTQAFSSYGKRGLSSSCSAWASHCGVFSCCRAQALGHVGLVVAVHRLSCSLACGIFLEQGSNLCPLLQQADSCPLHHQGSPVHSFLDSFPI